MVARSPSVAYRKVQSSIGPDPHSLDHIISHGYDALRSHILWEIAPLDFLHRYPNPL